MKTPIEEMTVSTVEPAQFEMTLTVPACSINYQIWQTITHLIIKWYSQNNYYALYRDAPNYRNSTVRIFSAADHLATTTIKRIDFYDESKNVIFIDLTADEILKPSREFLYELKLKLNKECNFNMTDDYEDIDLAIEKFTTAKLCWITDLNDINEINKQRRSKML